jgi:hypothetical protein
MHSMIESGVTFDGRSYWYQQYRYDGLNDALAYARLDRSRLAGQAEAGHDHHWQEPATPTAADLQLMTELGISFDGRCYHYGDYRYDRIIDAINYARLMHTGPVHR